MNSAFDHVSMLGKYHVEFEARDGHYSVTTQATDHMHAISLASASVQEHRALFGGAPVTFTRCTLVAYRGSAE